VAQTRVLVLGVYLADRANTIAHIVPALSSAKHCMVVQRWVAAGGPPPTEAVGSVTTRRMADRMPKFTLINSLLREGDQDGHDFIIVCDDDIKVPEGFVDRFIGWQQHCGFDLAQPARSWNSYVDHAFVRSEPFTRARETRFVEIGPVFCMSAAMSRVLMPFDETSPMGWGYDLVWPVLARARGLRLGIIDDVPIEHSLRRRGAAYAMASELETMEAYLDQHEHLAAEDCFAVLRRYR
jgi:hypothetical protein